MKQLTITQRRVLQTIIKHIARVHRTPTYRDMQDLMGYASHNGVKCHIKALRRKGHLVNEDGRIALSDDYEVVVRRKVVSQPLEATHE